MFNLSNKRRYQLIGLLVIFLLILTFLPALFSDKSADHAENIALKQKPIIYVVEDDSAEDLRYQGLNDFIEKNEIAHKDQSAVSEAQAAPQTTEIEPQSSTVAPNDKLTMTELVNDIESGQPYPHESQAAQKTTPNTLQNVVKVPQTSHENPVSGSYYVRLAALTRADYVQEKTQLLKKNKYTVSTKKSRGFTILLAGPYESEAAAKKELPNLIKLGFKEAEVMKE